MNFTKNNLDILKETCNIASGNAISALADFTGKNIDIYIPDIELISFREIPTLLGNEEDLIVAIFQDVSIGFNASIMFALDEVSTKMLIHSIMSQFSQDISDDYNNIDITNLTDEELSLIKELSNILTGHYLNGIANFLNKQLDPSPPAIAIDMAGAILPQILFTYETPPDKLFLIKTEIFLDNKKINGQIFMMPKENALDTILGTVEANYVDI